VVGRRLSFSTVVIVRLPFRFLIRSPGDQPRAYYTRYAGRRKTSTANPPPRGAFVGHEREGTSYLFASFPGQQCCNGWVGYSFRNDRIIIWQDTHRIEVVPADLPSITDVQLSLLDSQLELRLLK